MKSFLKAVAGLVLFIAAAVGIITLVNNLTRHPSSILTSDCTPPCWYGIQPGETTMGEALEILDGFEEVNQNSIMLETGRNSSEIEKVSWRFQRPGRDSGGSVQLEDERVVAIRILTIGSLTLADALNQFGQPDQIWTQIGTGQAREFLEITLLYPTQGYVVAAIIDLEGKNDHVDLQESTPIYRITYFDPSQFEELLETRALIDQPMVSRKGSLKPWPGLGPLNFER
jgi:hypothetical protein